LVVYDIPDDAVRTRVADACLDYGLERIQYSAFLGDISPNCQEELFLKIRRQVGARPANVQLFPMCERDARRRRVLASAPATGRRRRAGRAGRAGSPTEPTGRSEDRELMLAGSET
jgi:CRISPR-associated protein Cas2